MVSRIDQAFRDDHEAVAEGLRPSISCPALLAQDEAAMTLLDAERLAAAVLVAAEAEAQAVVARARASAAPPDPDDDPPGTDVSQARHDVILAELAECRQEFQAVLESFRQHASSSTSRRPPTSGAGLPAAMSIKVQGRRVSAPGAVKPSLHGSNEAFLAALYRAAIGIEPLDPGWCDGDSLEAEVGEPSLRSISTTQAGFVVTLASRRGCAAPPVPHAR